MTDATTTIEAPAGLESEVCSRCGGTGNYSYCPRFGTRCFKCDGHKRVYTKRGAVAAKFLESIRSKPVGEIKVGDVVWANEFSFSGWAKVESIEPTTDENCGGWLIVDDERVPTPAGLFNIVLTGKDGRGVDLRSTPQTTMFRMALKAEEKAETMARAIAYQATLTKAGTVRKK